MLLVSLLPVSFSGMKWFLIYSYVSLQLHDAITKYELNRKGWSCRDNSQEVQL